MGDSQPTLQLPILAPQQFQVLVNARLVPTAENCDLHLVAGFVYFAHHLLQLGMSPGCINDLRGTLRGLLLLSRPSESGAEQRHGLSSSSGTLDESVLAGFEIGQHLNGTKDTFWMKVFCD